MRILKKIILVAIVFLVNTTVYAWNGAYNYEVNYFDVKDNIATVSGWAILNARGGYQNNGSGLGQVLKGANDRQSGVRVTDGNSNSQGYLYKDDRGSIFYGGYCNYGSMDYFRKGVKVSKDYDSQYTYRYSMELTRVYKNGKQEKVNGAVTSSSSRPIVSLTYSQAYKCNKTQANFVNPECSGGDNYATACYENVGFKFNIDMSKLTFNESIKGYKMTLTVKTGEKSTCTKDCSSKFDLTIIAGVDGAGNIDTSNLINTTEKVTIIVTGGKPWNKPNFAAAKSSKVSYGQTYTVEQIKYDSEGNVTWYKLKNNGWVPASWVRPRSDITLIVGSTPPITCEETIIPDDVTDKVNQCDGTSDVTLETGNNCSIELTSSDFYSISCKEKVTTKFNPGVLTNLRIGEGFNYGIKTSSVKECTGTFDSTKWKEAYNTTLRIRNSYKSGTAEYKEYDNKLKDLVNMVKIYNDWDLNEYTINPTATMQVNYKKRNKKATDSVNFIVSERTNSTSLLNVTKKHNLGVNGLTNPNDFTYTNKDNPNTMSLVLPHVYLNTVTGNVETYKCNTCIDGGNKYYLDKNGDYGNYTLNVTVNSLGEFSNLTVVNDQCGMNVKDNDISYRPIDLTNPFIDAARTTGNNWLNNAYNFVNLIDKEVWSKNSLYVFDLTKKTIKEIKDSNDIMGAEAYLGTCHDSTNNDTASKYICEIINE